MIINTSIRIDEGIHARILEQTILNKKNMNGPTTVSRLIEVAVKKYLDSLDNSE